MKETITIPSPQAFWQVAEEKGWHSPSASFGEDIALIHSELSEALEAFRKLPPEAEHKVLCNPLSETKEGYEALYAVVQKECIAEDLADAVIRIGHLCGKLDIDLEAAIIAKHEKNKLRLYRHGNKAL